MTLPVPRPEGAPCSRGRPSSRRAFGIALMMVVLLFVILLVLLSAQSRSTRSVAYERNLSFLGSRARVATQNALNEAYYHFISRSNSPKLSEKGPVDLYKKLRAAREGEQLEYSLPPAVTRKLLRRDRISVGKVEVDLQLIEEVLSGAASGTTTSSGPSGSSTGVSWPAPAGVGGGGATSPGPGTWPSGPNSPLPSRYCDLRTVNFQPRVKSSGVARFRVTAKADGARGDVVRTVVVRKGFQLLQVTPAGDLILVRLSPNDISTHVIRSVVDE